MKTNKDFFDAIDGICKKHGFKNPAVEISIRAHSATYWAVYYIDGEAISATAHTPESVVAQLTPKTNHNDLIM